MAKIRYLGHSAFYVEGRGLKALIDPFLTGNAHAGAKPEDFTDLNYIFLTHGHGDHVGDTALIARRTGAVIIAPTELAAFFTAQGFKTENPQVGGRFSLPFGRVKLTPAWHGTTFTEGGKTSYAGVACGYIIEVDGKKIYHSGDTGLTMEMQLLQAEHIDVAMVPIGGYFTMDIDDAVRAVELIKPELVIPMHYNTFPKIKADPREFEGKVGGLAGVRVMEPDEEYVIR